MLNLLLEKGLPRIFCEFSFYFPMMEHWSKYSAHSHFCLIALCTPHAGPCDWGCTEYSAPDPTPEERIRLWTLKKCELSTLTLDDLEIGLQ